MGNGGCCLQICTSKGVYIQIMFGELGPLTSKVCTVRVHTQPPGARVQANQRGAHCGVPTLRVTRIGYGGCAARGENVLLVVWWSAHDLMAVVLVLVVVFDHCLGMFGDLLWHHRQSSIFTSLSGFLLSISSWSYLTDLTYPT